MAPKAFMSHASEDKERFVIAFARKLREKGIDVWLDRWEMQPGDSLVDRIFEQGIKDADAFIIVLSANSVAKPWVREELNVGFVKRISGKCRVIPVVIDDCEVPECLKSTLWERVRSLEDIDMHVVSIANTIHGIIEKPPIGPPPAHVTTPLEAFPSLNRHDRLVLKLACELTLDLGWPMVRFATFEPLVLQEGLSHDELIESLQVLEHQHYVAVRWAMGGGLSHFEIGVRAFEEYLRTTVPDYPQMVDQICLAMLNHGLRTNHQIQQETGLRERIVNHVLEHLDARGFAKLFRATGGGISIREISPQLNRHYRNN